MLDLLSRAIRHPLDYLNILKRHKIYFAEHLDEGKGAHSFIFTYTDNIQWKSGQHAIFTMPRQKVTGKKMRVFSVASSPLEKQIRIGTVIPEAPSDFKKKMLALKKGDVINMYGPLGEFHLQKKTRIIVGIAGGIGITPFRSILYTLSRQNPSEVSLKLIYAGKNGYFTYREELDNYAKNNNILISYVNTPEEVNSSIDAAIEQFGNSAEYYISGSPGMIGACRKRLRDKGITKITNDPFKGY